MISNCIGWYVDKLSPPPTEYNNSLWRIARQIQTIFDDIWPDSKKQNRDRSIAEKTIGS